MADSLGTKLRVLREEHGFTLDQVAKLIGMARNTVYSYEADIREPSYATLKRFAYIYKVSSDYLLGITEEDVFQVSGLNKEQRLVLQNLVDYMKSNTALQK